MGYADIGPFGSTLVIFTSDNGGTPRSVNPRCVATKAAPSKAALESPPSPGGRDKFPPAPQPMPLPA